MKNNLFRSRKPKKTKMSFLPAEYYMSEKQQKILSGIWFIFSIVF